MLIFASSSYQSDGENINSNQELIQEFSATGLNKGMKNEFFSLLDTLNQKNSTFYSISLYLDFFNERSSLLLRNSFDCGRIH